MATYKIVGSQRVAGRASGEMVSDDDLAAFDANVEALIAGGHIVATKAAKATDKGDEPATNGDA